uniref:Uncharacterized protein n=1 Tax=Brassica oleracea var. oleracea TaxID=109376 RepID=A0A0D3ADH0_BRAOL
RLKYLKRLSFSLTTPLIQSLNYTYLSYHSIPFIQSHHRRRYKSDIVYGEDLLCSLTLFLEWLDYLGDHKEAYMKNLSLYSALGSLSISFICSSAMKPIIKETYKEYFGDASELTPIPIPGYLQRLRTAHPDRLSWWRCRCSGDMNQVCRGPGMSGMEFIRRSCIACLYDEGRMRD